MPDAKAVLEKALELVDKANKLGVAVKTAVQAFYDSLFPTFAASGPGDVTAFGSCPPELQADILDAVDAVKED